MAEFANTPVRVEPVASKSRTVVQVARANAKQKLCVESIVRVESKAVVFNSAVPSTE